MHGHNGFYNLPCMLFAAALTQSNLRSWVEQRSPACAAACVAGTFNAIKPADCPARLLQQEDVMEVRAGKPPSLPPTIAHI